MKVSEQWLRELVNPALAIEDIAEKLTFAGVELDAIEAVASDFTNVVVGEISAVEAHPDADRLKVCQVDVGEDKTVQIVTNVVSVTAGQKFPVARIGATLPEPDGTTFKIKQSKLRGVLSQGMFCGAETLGITDSSDATDGLLEIPQDATPGANLRSVLDLDDKVLDLDITPNRADCLSMVGIAREVGVLTETNVTELTQPAIEAVHGDTLEVSIEAPDACLRYAGRIIHDVNTRAATPDWMVQKLHRAGLRSLSSVVDITNYVLLELGQPMHAFDVQKLDSGIHIRMAQAGEKLQLLDGNTIDLKPDSLVIADGKGAQALAGIMGGMHTSVSDDTQSIFLESAHFSPQALAGKARSYGLHTDSSHRFERGVSADLPVTAIERATRLILDICGGEAGKVTDVIVDNKLLSRTAIHLRETRITKVLGIPIPANRVASILQRLGCQVSLLSDASSNSWDVIPPVFRFDMVLEVDLIEELARINGYDQIPATLRKMTPLVVQSKEAEIKLDSFHKVLTSRDYQEVVSYSFVDEKLEKLISPELEAIKLTNPLSTELSVMRTTLWPGLLKVVSYNLKRQQSRVRVFETGLTFVNPKTNHKSPLKNEPNDRLEQRKKISGAITGLNTDPQWAQTSTPVDYFDIKGDVEALLAEVVGSHFEFKVASHASLHPGQCAQIVLGDKNVGWVGALHPQLEKAFGLTQNVYLFELDIDQINRRELPAYSRVSAYPVIQRDIALLVDSNISCADIEQVIKKSEIVQLVDYYLFDAYSGDGVPEGQKSLALSLIFQDATRTLKEAEITLSTNTLINQLNQATGAVLR